MITIIILILSSLYFFLPAYFANMAPVVFKKVNFLNIPVDFSKKWKNKPLLGSHKTWRGLFFGILTGIIIAFIQSKLTNYSFFAQFSFADYSNWFLIGLLLSSGALVGDMVKSFFKRRVNVKPGQRFIPWDQLDYTLGGILFVYFIQPLATIQILTLLIVGFFGHILVNHLGYYLKINKTKW